MLKATRLSNEIKHMLHNGNFIVCLPMEDGKLENINVSSMSLSSNVMNGDDNGGLHCCLNGDSIGLSY